MSAPRAPVPLLAAVALAAAGCFSEHATGPTGLEDRVPDIECAVALPTPGPTEVVVGIRDFSFHPAVRTVPPGTTVTWVNCEPSGIASHTTTSDDGVWDSGLLAPGGATYSRTFDEVGSFPYHCTPHPFMTGEVRVE
ncbi:MAG: plastocyanin/azurin family copper-binding protein [Gemmatimonadota bacterium]|jgi:plastocyanin